MSGEPDATPAPRRVFISHTPPDLGTAELLADLLTDLGHTVWLDHWMAVPGEARPAVLQRAADAVDVVLKIVGAGPPDTVEHEVRALLERRPDLHVVPVLLPGAPPVAALPGDPVVVDFRTAGVDIAAVDAALARLAVPPGPGTGPTAAPGREPGAAPGSDLDAQIHALHGALADLPAAGAEHRAARVRLAGLLGMRYTQARGTDRDRAEAQQIVDDVLADPAATPGERQAMSLLRPVLTMLSVTPASPLRGHDPATADAVGLVQPWLARTDPGELLAGLEQLAGQLAAIPEIDSLPPKVRAALSTLDAGVALMQDLQRPGWDGTVSPDVLRRLRAAEAGAPGDLPGAELLGPLLAYLDGPGDPAAAGARAAQLRELLTGLPADALLRPALEQDLARALVTEAERTGRPDALGEAVGLLERAAAGLAPDHPLYAQARDMLVAALLTTAAREPTAAAVARAAAAAEELLGATRESATRECGPVLLLRALAGLLRGRVDGDRAAAGALRDLLDALDWLPAGHALRPVAVGQLGAVLADRFLLEGLPADAGAATAVLDRVAAIDAGLAGDGDGAAPGFLLCVAALSRVNAAIRLGDRAAVEAATAALRTGLARLPADHLLRPNVEFVLGVAGLQLAGADRARLRAAVAELRRVAGPGLAGVAPAAAASLRGLVDVLGGLLAEDPAEVLRGIEQMEAQLASPSVVADQRVVQWAALGKAHLAAIDAGYAAATMAPRAVTVLQAARGQLAERRPGLLDGEILRDLALAHRAAGDPAAARRAAGEALQVRAGDVLLQTGIADALRTARGAAADAATLAGWCLTDNDPAGAVQAIELGRGLLLHAATSTLRVPRLLREAGRPDLAEAWRRAAADRAPAVPADFDPGSTWATGEQRLEALDTLRRRPECAHLFGPPSIERIQRALASAGADALVYLLPGGAGGAGWLLLVERSGPARAVPAPLLRDDPGGPLAAFLQAGRPGRERGRERSGDRDLDLGGPGPAWSAALSAVCDWAGPAALEPLLAALDAPGRPAVPRVVLVPGGRLGAVPWAAARLAIGTPAVRPACRDLVLSTAASARQLIDASHRAPLPITAEPALVGNPNGDLPGAAVEVRALWRAFYPGARVLGRLDTGPAPDGAGTPGEVLGLLPGPGSAGASLLVLACHARTAGTAEQSRLELTGPLPIRAVLEHAAGRAGGEPGPAVVLSGCRTDLTERDQDEALTLATAFLAAGAATVVGSRWAVDDRRTAVLMFAFHHFLAAGQPAAAALRSAQLWMLDPGRAQLPRMPEDLRRDAGLPGLADDWTWAAFTHHGR